MAMKNKDSYCIFCGGTGMSKQHVWPDWMKTVIPRENKQEHYQNMIKLQFDDSKYASITPEILKKRGHVATRKIRNVCKKCNGGWMSRLETSVKPKMTDMMLNKQTILTNSEMLSISAWAVMISIMAEFTDIPTKSIPDQDLTHLMRNQCPPSNWTVWIGKYKGQEWNYRYRHHGIGCMPLQLARIMKPFTHCNTQSSTFVVGSFLIHTTSSTLSGINPIFDKEHAEKLIQIWPLPLTVDCVNWSLLKEINDNEVILISDQLFKQFQPYPHS
ncbi:hypothetical protein [Shewanella xiamenensis]|uniref:hypothetical protein n=1 Tax=Shewanella xiamenensis TaxID=332186 RepID=UPI00313D7BB3